MFLIWIKSIFTVSIYDSSFKKVKRQKEPYEPYYTTCVRGSQGNIEESRHACVMFCCCSKKKFEIILL